MIAWQRKKISINRWEACGFSITQTADLDGVPFTLATPDGADVEFDDLDLAKRHAELLNDLSLEREECRRLRDEVRLLRDGQHFERTAALNGKQQLN